MNKIDVGELNRQIDLLALVGQDTELKRVASTNGGEWVGPCPFCGGDDRFHVWPEHSNGPQFWCRVCGEQGRATWYLWKRDGLALHEIASRYAHGLALGDPGGQRRRPAPRPARVAAPGSEWQAGALAFVQDCEAALWSERGARALDWLHARGLDNRTVKAHRLGFNSHRVEKAGKFWAARGVTIPWLDANGTLWKVNVATGSKVQGKKYFAVVGGNNAGLYGVDRLTGDKPALVVEGEFDAMLAWQHLGDRVDVLTVGGNQCSVSDCWLAALMPVKRFIIATDNDQAGEKAAERWLELVGERGTRVLPPGGQKDITDSWRAGCDLGGWLGAILGDGKPAAGLNARVVELRARCEALGDQIRAMQERHRSGALGDGVYELRADELERQFIAAMNAHQAALEAMT